MENVRTGDNGGGAGIAHQPGILAAQPTIDPSQDRDRVRRTSAAMREFSAASLAEIAARQILG